MSSRSREYSENPQSYSLSHAIDAYLGALRHYAPSLTSASHATTLAHFRDHHLSQQPISELNPLDLAQFIARQYRTSTFSTVYGYISTISNCLAYTRYASPYDEQLDIIHALPLVEEPAATDLYDDFRTLKDYSLTHEETLAVEKFVEFVRSSAHGTRLHVVVELILDTRSQLEPILDIDLGDIDEANERVSIPTSDEHVVGRYGLLAYRDDTISESTTSAITNYTKWDRKGGSESNSPLLKSWDGRVTRSTIHREWRGVRDRAKKSSTIVRNGGVADGTVGDFDEVGNETGVDEFIHSESDHQEHYKRNNVEPTLTIEDVTPSVMRRYAIEEKYPWQTL